MRTAIDLNFNWKYADHFSENMLRPAYDEADMREVNIPHTNKELPYNYFDEKDYQFVCCYRKGFRAPADVFENGLTLCGGTALLPGIDKYFAEKLGMTVSVADDPALCVCRGTEKIIDSAAELLQVVSAGDED